MPRWYETFFANYAKAYDREPFVHGTVGECDFVERELAFDKTKRILDIGCGTGRHAIELARRGYRVTGFDLSAAQLARAREKAAAAGVAVAFEQRDAARAHFSAEFDLAIMFCEGSFCLLETDELNHQVLIHAAAALRPGGKLLMTALNALFPLLHSVKDFYAASQSAAASVPAPSASAPSAAAPSASPASANSSGVSPSTPPVSAIGALTFDLLTFRESAELTFTDDAGEPHTIQTNERYYTPAELIWLLKKAGFAKVEIFGAQLGAFSREHALTSDDFEILAIAQRTP